MSRALRVIGLQSPRGRLLAIAIISVIVFVLPYQVVGQFSLWARLGWDSAPSIGLTRAYWLLIHGQPVAAWHRNWLIFPVLLALISLLARDVWTLRRPAGHSDENGK